MPINHIVIPVPNTFRSLYDLDSDNTPYCSFFHESLDQLILRVQPEDYTRIVDRTVEERDSWGGTSILMSGIRVGIEVTVTDGREEIWYALEHLDRLSRTSTGYVAITITDYVKPEYEDLAQGYTTRTGYFKSIEPQSGTMRDADSYTSRRYGKGVRFTFMEKERRR